MDAEAGLRAGALPAAARRPQDAELSSESREPLEDRFHRILQAYGRALARVAASYEPAAGRREDLLQEIAFALWRALPGFRGECSERTFVFRLAHNRGLTHVWRRPPPAAALEEGRDVADPAPGPESRAESGRRRERLMEAIQVLPVAYRQVLTLSLEELSQAEIAQVLGITENNVAVRLSRARRALREALPCRP